MNIENETGFPHFQFEKVGYYGELFTVVVVNQTFDFSYSGGLCLIADEQRLPLMTDSWFGEPESSSLKTATDLVCRKVRADVLLNGHAWHATGETTRWQASLQVGNLQRQFDICGPCQWQYISNRWQLSEPELTDRVLLRHELASASEFNPVGIVIPSLITPGDKSPCPAPQLSA
nr:DUF2169 domain-containing protein [Escherichia coli]